MTLQNLDTAISFAVIMLGVSLLMTVVTQMVTTLLGLRGTNLKRGLVDLLKTVHPELEAYAENIAQKVLEHPLLSDSVFARLGSMPGKNPFISWWRLSSAVRIEELLGILEKLSEGQTPPAANAKAATIGQAMAAIVAAAHAKPGPEVKALGAQVRELAKSIPGGAAGAPSNFTVQLDRITQQIPATAEATLTDLKSWFNSAMDRTAQRFTLHARLVTVIVSILFVFGAHFDALRVLRQLSLDPQMRASLVQSAEAMKKQAEVILTQPAQAPSPAAGAPAVAPTPPTKQQDDLNRPKDLDELKKEADSIKRQLGQTGFQLIPDPYPGVWNFTGDNLWGILAAAALLSLGAPFWFNVLKNLSNLRPILATKQEQEQGQRKAA
jgi:hypothetical protein